MGAILILFALGCGLALTGTAGLRQRARTGREKVRIAVGLTVAAGSLALGGPTFDDFASRKLQRGCLPATEMARRICDGREAIPPQPDWCYPINVTCAVGLAESPSVGDAAALPDAANRDGTAPPDASTVAAECEPGARRCAGVYAETCSARGQWGSRVNCSKSRPCREGVCTLWTTHTPPAASY